MGLAPQIRNPGSRGSNARYDITGLTRRDDGRYTDGTWTYDQDGRSWDRPDSVIPGLKGADDNGPGGGGGGGGTGIPGGALIAQAQLAAKTRYQQRLAQIAKRRQSTGRTAGYTHDVDPETGLAKNWRVDPMNQYGTFQLLNRQQAREGQQVEDMNIGRGLGTGGGLAAQNLNEARFGWGQQDSAFGQSLLDQLGALDEEQQGAKYEYDERLWQLQLEALRMADSAGDYGDYGGGGWGFPEDEDTGGGAAGGSGPRYPGLTKATQPVKVGGKWHGAWGPAPSKATKKIISGIKSVKPMLPKPAPKPVIKASTPYATRQYTKRKPRR